MLAQLVLSFPVMEDRRARARRLARATLFAALFALGGCGHTQQAGEGPQPDDGPATPRLLPWQLQAAGSSPLEVGMFDSLRGVHCRFLHDTEGELRCLPLAPPSLEPGDDFADAGCSELRVPRAALGQRRGHAGAPCCVAAGPKRL